MKDVKYIGDRGPVEIEVGPQLWQPVEPGGVVSLRDDLADSLADQPDMWELVVKPATKTSKKAEA